MNTRQRKKNFKKIYGFNPSHATSLIGGVMKAVVKMINDLAPKVKKGISDLTERIKEMPEDEFDKLINSKEMAPGTIELARRIRGNK